jgi:hypothetical protein
MSWRLGMWMTTTLDPQILNAGSFFIICRDLIWMDATHCLLAAPLVYGNYLLQLDFFEWGCFQLINATGVLIPPIDGVDFINWTMI